MDKEITSKQPKKEPSIYDEAIIIAIGTMIMFLAFMIPAAFASPSVVYNYPTEHKDISILSWISDLFLNGKYISEVGRICFTDGTCAVTSLNLSPTTYLAAGNVTAGSFGSDWGGGDYSFPNNLSVAGNASATYFIGNGSLLTGISVGNYTAYVDMFHTLVYDPTGFANKTTSTLSFNDSTRNLTITGSPTYTYWVNGINYTKTSDSIVIPNTIGINYIYYDGNTLKQQVTEWEFEGIAMVAIIYWNGTSAIVSDERHGVSMDWATHEYMHATVGTRYETGLSATFNNTGFSVEGGIIHDEDIEYILPQSYRCDVLYRNGANWTWLYNQTQYFYKNATNMYYDNGGVLTPVGVSQFMAIWVFATNDIKVPYMCMLGQRTDNNIANARTNNDFTTLSVGTLPLAELKILYRVILKNVASPYQEASDYRQAGSLATGGTFTATSHSALTGLTNDDHIQYLRTDGTRTMTGNLDVNGYNITAYSININGSSAYYQDNNVAIKIAKGIDAYYANVYAGVGAGSGTQRQTAIGYYSGYQNIGILQSVLGYFAGYGNNGSQQTAIGYYAGYQNIGSDQMALGYQAGYQNKGLRQTAVGVSAGYQNIGDNQGVLGYQAGYQNNKTGQTAFGAQSGYINTGDYQTALGNTAGYLNTGNTQTAVGRSAGYLNTKTQQTAIGGSAGLSNAGDYQTAVGYYSGYQNTQTSQAALGWYAGYQNIGDYQTAIGRNAGISNSGTTQTALGAYAGGYNNGSSQTVVGYRAGYQNTANFQTAWGRDAGNGNTGDSQTAVGYYAGYQNTGLHQVAIGHTAGYLNNANYQMALGYLAGYINTGSYETAIGYYAGSWNNGSRVIGIGAESALYNNASDVVAIGYQAGKSNTVANQFIVKQTNINAVPLIQGDFSTGRVGINTASPSYPLTVVGNVSGISIWSEGNVSAAGYITRTQVYDKTKGKALDKIKDASDYLYANGTINHSAFNYSGIKYSKQVVSGYKNSTVFMLWNETISENETDTIVIVHNETIHYSNPIYTTVQEQGISLDAEVALLKQAIYELKVELCSVKPNAYTFCGGL